MRAALGRIEFKLSRIAHLVAAKRATHHSISVDYGARCQLSRSDRRPHTIVEDSFCFLTIPVTVTPVRPLGSCEHNTPFTKEVIADPQTSGGLLIAIASNDVDSLRTSNAMQVRRRRVSHPANQSLGRKQTQVAEGSRKVANAAQIRSSCQIPVGAP